MPTKNRIFLILVAFYLCYTLFPLLSDLFPVPPSFVSIFVFAVCLLLYPGTFVNKTVFWAAAYLVIMCVYHLAGKSLTIGIGAMSNSNRLLIEAAWILPALSINSIMLYLNDKKIYSIISVFTISVVVLSALYIIPLLASNRVLLRMDDFEENIDIKVMGLPSYPLMHSYVMLLPTIIFIYKNVKARKKIFTLIAVLLLVYLIYSTYITTTLFLSIFIIFAAFLFDGRNYTKLIAYMALFSAIFMLFYYSGLIISILDELILFYDDTFVAGKLIDIKNSISLGHVQGDNITGRMDFHDISWNGFFSNPLTGNGIVGGHSSLIDRLGGMGLLVFIPFANLLISIFKTTHIHLSSRDSKFFYFLSCIATLVLLYNKGLFGSPGWVMYTVVVPSVFFALPNNKNKKV